MYTTRYTTFADWLDSVTEFFNLADIVANDAENSYEFKIGDDVVAYWDRSAKMGAISKEVFEA